MKALKKPSVPAWAVNRVRFSDPKLVERLLASGDALRTRKGGDPRAAMQARRVAIAAVRAQAEKALEAEGHSATPQTMQRVAATLEALATYGTQTGAPVPGRLSEELTPPGFDELAAMGLLAGAQAAPSKPAAAAKPAAPPPPSNPRDERREREERRRAAETERAAKERTAKERKSREKALAEARARLAKAERALAEARRERESLAGALEKAARKERAAEDEANGARAAAAEMQRYTQES